MLSSDELGIILLSLKVALCSVAFSLPLAILIAYVLARFDFAHVLRVQQIESARFTGYDPRNFTRWRGEFREIQWAEAARIAHRVQFIRRQYYQ